nr:hypothetical protein [Tanacetum cinerariifolium]
METNESLKSKSFESSEKVCSESENQSENDCLVIEKECDKEENPKVIAPGMFKLNVSKSSCDSKNMEIKLKRKRHLDTFSIVRRPRHRDVVWKKKWSSNTSNVGSESENQSENDCLVIEKECDKEENPKVITPGMFKLNVSKSSCDYKNMEIKLKRKRHLDTFSIVRRPRHRDVVWKKKLSSNTSNVGLSDMPFRKKPRDSMNVRSKSNLNTSLPRTVHCPDLSLDHRFGMFKAYDG